jgi:hypothetical protein
MFRKSVFITVFVCLLTMSSVVMAYPWEGQLEWNSSAFDANWYNAANWTNQGTPVCPTDGTGPSWNNYCAVLPNQPGPRITGNATTSMLSLNPWAPTSWGGQDCNVIITATALDVNCGTAIQINSQSDYDSYLGTPNLVNRAILNVYGGTVTTPRPDGGDFYGLTVGGGGSHFGMSYGMLNIYGGLVKVPRVRLFYGEIGLNGGTLQITTDSNFTVSATHPEATLNKVKINGGTLILEGDQTAAINGLIASSYIVCERGVLGAPTYDIGTNKTTLIADVNYCTWRPQPANNATNIHYKKTGTSDPCSVTLSWAPSTFDDADVNHDVYFGATFADVNTATKLSAAYKGTRYDFPHYGVDANGDPCSWTIKEPNAFAMTPYYWRVDEINDFNVVKKGIVWKFTAHDGKAYNPKPKNAATALSQPLQLSWTAGDFASSTNGHRVYFNTTTPVSISTADPLVYRGTQSGTTYNLKNLLPTYTLTPGATYYWKIVEVNTTYGTQWISDTFSFTPNQYTNIDDFEDSISTDDVNNNWVAPYIPTGASPPLDYTCVPSLTGDSSRILMRDITGKYLRYGYRGGSGARRFSEARRPYVGGASFTGGGVISPAPRALRIDYRGYAVNAAHPTDDRMYVAIEDTAGNVSVYDNPDPNAQLIGNWTSWYSNLYDINAAGLPNPVNLEAISGFAIGFGIRCNDYSAIAGDGNVMFDNIRLYASTCVAAFGPTADLDEDCDVDINDMDALAADWLFKAEEFTYAVTQPAPPILWYKFNGADQNNLTPDYGTGDANDYTGTVQNFVATNWKVDGGRDGNGCLYLPPGGGCYVVAPVTALGFMGDATHDTPGGGGISFAVWANADLTDNEFLVQWCGLFGTWDANSIIETLEVHCPANLPLGSTTGNVNFYKRTNGPVDFLLQSAGRQLSDFSGRWNHWVFIKEPSRMSMYLNGQLIKYADANGQPGDPNAGVYGPLFNKAVGAFRIGTRGTNWAYWIGRMDDFQVYDYALSQAEVQWLVTDGTGYVFLPLVSPANIKADGTPIQQIVNFGDLAIMGQQWHTQILWP